jgi:chemotaxis protein MotA
MTIDTETETNVQDRPTGTPIEPPVGRARVDLATILGIGSAVILVVSAIILGGSISAFFDVRSVFIVLGGTIGVTTACFSLTDMSTAIRVTAQTVFHRTQNPSAAAVHVLQLAQIARYQGVLVLQNHMDAVRDERILHRGLAMALDGTPGDTIERILQQEIQAMENRHSRSASVLRKAAEISPAMGLIGTLVGLVQMLGSLSDPSSIGPKMALALLTTFYGAVLSNLVFTPLASKLERNSSDEALINQLHAMAAASIGRQENPRRLEMLLNTILPPGNRIEYFT